MAPHGRELRDAQVEDIHDDIAFDDEMTPDEVLAYEEKKKAAEQKILDDLAAAAADEDSEDDPASIE